MISNVDIFWLIIVSWLLWRCTTIEWPRWRRTVPAKISRIATRSSSTRRPSPRKTLGIPPCLAMSGGWSTFWPWICVEHSFPNSFPQFLPQFLPEFLSQFLSQFLSSIPSPIPFLNSSLDDWSSSLLVIIRSVLPYRNSSVGTLCDYPFVLSLPSKGLSARKLYHLVYTKLWYDIFSNDNSDFCLRLVFFWGRVISLLCSFPLLPPPTDIGDVVYTKLWNEIFF